MDRRTHADEARQRMDGRKPLVAGDAAALAIMLQVVKEFANDCRGQVLHGHAIDSAAALFAGEWQQQHQSVAVAGLGVSGEIALGHQMLQQEPPNPRAQKALILHDRPPLRTGQSVGLPPGADPASFVGSVGSIGYRGGQGRWRVAGAIAGRPGRSDTMRAPDAPPLCGECRAGVEVEVRRRGN